MRKAPKSPELDRRDASAAVAVRATYSFYRNLIDEARGGPGDFGTRHIPMWDGGRDRNGRTHQPVWPKIAAKLRSLQIEPAVYVEACFAELGQISPPQPNLLLSKQADEAYQRYVERAGHQEAIRLRVAKDTFVTAVLHNQTLYQMDVEEAARMVLVDLTVPLPPLFRYLAAKTGGAPEIAERWREIALGQLVVGFFRFSCGWGAEIPDDLVDEASRVLDLVSKVGTSG